MTKRLSEKLGGAFTKIARAMSRNFGIEVVPSGFACNTDGVKTIRIPFNADDMAEADQKVLHGLLDHEIQHVVEEREALEAKARGEAVKTPNDVMKACRTKREKMLLNVFEDIRIETKASRSYIGVAENLNAANLNSVEMFKRRHEADGMEHANFWHALGSAIILKARGYSTDWVPAGMLPYLAMVEPEIQASKRTQRVEDCHKLALAVLKKVGDKVEEIKQEQEKREKARKEAEEKARKEAEEKAEQEKAEQEKGEEDEAEADKGEDEADGADDSDEGEDEGDGEDGEEDQVKGSSKGEDGEGDEDGEADSADSDKGEAEADEADEGEGEEQPKGGKGKAGEGDLSEMSDEELDAAGEVGSDAATDADTTDALDEVKDQVKTAAVEDAKDSGRYIPNPDAQKRDRWITPDGDMSDYESAREVVNSQIHAMKAKLLTLIRSRSAALYEGDQERGDIDVAALYGLRLGNKRIFSKRTEESTLDTAVSILIDLSGSMGIGRTAGNAAYYAKLMAIALGETLAALNVPFEVIGFHNTHDGYAAEISPEGFSWGRWMPFQFHVYKAFGEVYRTVKARLASVTGMQENVDGEAVLAVARRLIVREESRKIMFVLSDGQPCGGCDHRKAQQNLKDTVKMITSSGIEVFGIGANSASVKDFYGREQGASYIVVDDISKLAVEVYRLMRSKMSGLGERKVA